MKYVIIGNGVAGIRGAEAIRELDPSGDITLIADESHPPYCRPMISMMLEGSVTSSDLPIRKTTFYNELNIRARLGRRADFIDADARLVRLPAQGGHPEEKIPFDRLLIATGADPRPIQAHGLDLDNIFYMRTQAHVQAMLDGLDGVKKGLVLGGGLVGFKAAYGLLRRGIGVTMLIKSGYPLSMQVDPVAGNMISDELKAHGLDVHVGREVTAFEGNGKVRRAVTSDGGGIDCHMVIIGKGVLPALSLIPRDKIRVDLGVVVNSHMETSAPGIYAAGDAAEFVDIARDSPWVNAIWPEAVIQGRVAGMNMAGRPVAYPGSLSRNVIRIFGLDIMTAGIVNPPQDDEFQVKTDHCPRKKTFRKLVFQEDRLAGMVLVNDVEQGGVLMNLISSRRPITGNREGFLSPSFNFARLLKA